MGKAQAAVELIVVVAAIMLVLSVLFEFSQTNLNENISLIQLSQARNTVNSLAEAASEVHNEGVGARMKVYITIPDGVNPNRIIIGNGTITIGVYVANGTSDVSSTQLGFTIVQGGFFPTTPGSYWVWVIGKQGYVQIGSSINVNPLAEYFELFPNNSSSRNISFTNYGTAPVNVSLALVWSDSEVSTALNGSGTISFPLQAGTSNSQIVNLSASANSNASRGLHSGYISVATNISEGETIPVTVNVVSQPIGLQTISYITIDTYNDSTYTYSNTSFQPYSAVYYSVKSYNSTDNLANSTVTVRVYNPSSVLISEQTYPPNSTGTYQSYYTPLTYASGSWKITAYDIGGVSADTYFTIATPQYPSYTLFGSSTTIQPFNLQERAICRDSSNYIHIAWLYNSTQIDYAKSTNNGNTFAITVINSSSDTKYAPHITCSGSNIFIAFTTSASISSISIYNSSNNGASWTYQQLRAVGLGLGPNLPVNIESLGSKVYVFYTKQDCSNHCTDLAFFNSSDGGNTWGNDVIIAQGAYDNGKYTACTQDYQFITSSVNGSGGSSDNIYVEYYFSQSGLCGSLIANYLSNSSNSGVTWSTPNTDVASAGYPNPSMTSWGNSVYYSLSTDTPGFASYVYVYNSSTTPANYSSFSNSGDLDYGTNSSFYPSITMNGSNPVAFWLQNASQGNPGNFSIAYSSFNGNSWSPATDLITSGNNTYMNVKYVNTGNCLEGIYENGTASPYNLTYFTVGNCTAP